MLFTPRAAPDSADSDLVAHKQATAGDTARTVQAVAAPAIAVAKPAKTRPAVRRPTPRAARSTTRRARPAQQQHRGGQRPAPTRAPAAVPQVTSASPVVAFALAQVGKPYRWAAAGPGSFDCSGLVMAAYWRVGVNLPHQTGGMIRYGTPVFRANLQPGDIVFPSSHHVAIYIGGGRIVHAPHPGDHVRVAPLYAFWAARRM